MNARHVVVVVVLTAATLVACGPRTPRVAVAERRPQPEMVRIPGGEYLIGSEDGAENERPTRRVIIKPFLIDKYEVTNAQYLEFVQETGYPAPPRWRPNGTFWPEQADLPVTWVSWHDALAYANWRGVRLPTETEWEIAARCSSAFIYPWGDSTNADIGSRANIAGDVDGYELGPAPVNMFPSGASCWGVYNMAGNVWEWVADWYLPSAYQNLPETGPATVTTDSLYAQRVIRGGSWFDPLSHARTTSRAGFEPSFRSDILGFRCARDAE